MRLAILLNFGQESLDMKRGAKKEPLADRWHSLRETRENRG
jgi:hypothetical protein